MNLELLVDLHRGNPRQGPGGAEQTARALELAGLTRAAGVLRIADIGCGTGASTLVLAEALDADITAVDLSREFLDELEASVGTLRLKGRVTTLECSMDKLPFKRASLDAIWSEGAIYCMGFEQGARYFRELLVPGGILAVSELTWLTDERPGEVERYWSAEYPAIATAAEKTGVLEALGYSLEGYFALPGTCWTDNYYAPLEGRFDAFLARHGSADAEEMIEAQRAEIALYREYGGYYGYGFYIARKT